ncbi:hypothetical protein BS47DRAFT_1330944 [Hydnum rufescens UP504]|uniref:Ubiquitin-like domain-containing protein n=1 Tax=Hydnum rufescens UP504 TaxID=1448309 RepID=A0A9P6DV97_9AGAM|nr:hypothetical protein BS47DRAFT_1330944 [Hydnum rufescens UP504]
MNSGGGSSSPAKPGIQTPKTPPSNGNTVPQPPAQNGRTSGKKKTVDPTPDPVTMYESVRSRIAALEEEEGLEEEEDRKMAEQAHSAVRGMSDSAIHSKYVDLYQEMKRSEREYAKERQKLTKDKDAAKSQLTKANHSRTKLENLARELQKDNKRLREDSRRLLSSVEDAQEVIESMKSEIERRVDDVKSRRDTLRDQLKNPLFPSSTPSPKHSAYVDSSEKPSSASKSEVILKVVCKYRAELFFKVSRKTKLGRLFNAWTARMNSGSPGQQPADTDQDVSSNAGKVPNHMEFLFSYHGRCLDGNLTAEEVGIEDDDVIVAVEIMDLTQDADEAIVPPQHAERLKKNWNDDPQEARKAMEDIFDVVVRTRLEGLLTQYELRERHFEAIIRSKELEVLLAKARAEEQKHLADVERGVSNATEAQNMKLQQNMENMQTSQARLLDKLIACCKEVRPSGERSQRLFSFLREELQKRGTKIADETPPPEGQPASGV